MLSGSESRSTFLILITLLICVLFGLTLQACGLRVERREKSPTTAEPSAPSGTSVGAFQPSSGVLRAESSDVTVIATASTAAQMLKSDEVSATVRIGGSAKLR